MSFFKKSKNDMSRSDNELKNQNNAVNDNVKERDNIYHNRFKEEVKNSEQNTSLEDGNIEKDILEEMFENDTQDNLELQNITQIIDNALEVTEENVKDDRGQENMLEKKTSSSDELSTIAKGTVINGSISSDGSLNIMGSITGDIDCLGKLSVSGEINGNSVASQIYVNAPRLEGSLTSGGDIQIDDGSVVIGDVIATSGAISGAVKGQVDVNGSIIIDSKAIVKGNITAGSIQINSGAVVDGYCSIGAEYINMDAIFEKK